MKKNSKLVFSKASRIRMKKDKYLRAKGGKAQIVNVLCTNCGKSVLLYQKDGPGWLKRCYLNRILGPRKWEELQHNLKIKESNDMPNLVCDCGALIGVPMRHKDERLAFFLKRGKFKRKKITFVR